MRHTCLPGSIRVLACLCLALALPALVSAGDEATVTGTFTARHDPELARKIHRAISQVVTDAMGETRFVRGSDESTKIAQR